MNYHKSALDDLQRMVNRLPMHCFDWCEYKGETYYAMLNHERSYMAGKPMIDLHHCATQMVNGIVLKTVQYDKSKFRDSSLSK